MNIITGINSTKGKGKGKKEKGITILVAVAIMSILFGACVSKQSVQENEVSAKTDVKISSPIFNAATHSLSFQAVTRYMQSNDIRSQITGIITTINCSVAQNIHSNQALFTVQPQEAAALKKSKFSNQILTGYSDTVYARVSGQISKLNVQVGDFVQIGDVLASCVRANSMRIIAFIPVEQIGIIEKTKNCTVTLPDGTLVKGRVSEKLSSAEVQDQTQSYIIEPEKSISLAENINLTVQFTTEQIQDALFVPESAVMGNEEQTNFWLMKLINDSMCIKVPVEKGLKKDSLIEVIGTKLTTADRIISEGAYGLADSARVQIIHMKNESQSPTNPPANRKSTSSRH